MESQFKSYTQDFWKVFHPTDVSTLLTVNLKTNEDTGSTFIEIAWFLPHIPNASLSPGDRHLFTYRINC